jgi:hypothetical protein
MAAIRNGTTPFPIITRVLVLGYYDGATDGVLQCGEGGPVYRFDMIDEERVEDGMDSRTYQLRPLPSGSLDRLVEALVPYQPPAWPTWVPIWKFPTEKDQRSVEGIFDAVLDAAGPLEWELTTSDTVEFRSINVHTVPALPQTE